MAYPETGTKLTNLFNPQVVGDMVEKKLIDNLVFLPLCRVDSLLEGRPGNTVTLPSYNYIGDAADVAEGADISISLLTESTTTATVKKIGKGVQLTDEAVLSGYGDPLGEASSQIATAMAAKENKDVLAVLNGITGSMLYEGAAALLTADDIADALVKFGEDIEGPKVIIVSPAQYAALRKADDWCPASEIAAQLIIRGAVGMIHGCQVVVSNLCASDGDAYIVKPGALAYYPKRGVNIEFDRHPENKSTAIYGDAIYVVYLYDASKAIKLTVNPLNLSVASPASDATWLGKTISDVQTSVAFAANRVTGTLKYVSGWTQFSADPRYNTGNFCCFKVTAATGTTIYAGLTNPIDPTRPEWVTDADGEFVFQISDKATQKIRVKLVKGSVEEIVEYDLNDLVCNAS